MESLLGILKDGFKGYYCEEQFKVNKEIIYSNGVFL